MKSLIKTAAASILFVAVTASADSDYGLVVKGVNRLIDLYELVQLDVKHLSEDNKAIHAEIEQLRKSNGDINASYSSRLNAMEAKLGQRDDGKIEELRASLEGVQVHLSGLENKIAEMDKTKKSPSMDTQDENVRAQETRLQKFLEQTK